MIRSRTAAIAVAAAAGLGAFAATVIGGQSQPQAPGNPPPADLPVLETHRVKGPSGPLSRPNRAGEPRVFYYETRDPINDIPSGTGGEIIEKCPKGSIATNGYWFVQGTFQGFGLDDQGSSPAGFRRWAFYWFNNNKQLDGLTLGMVCDRDG